MKDFDILMLTVYLSQSEYDKMMSTELFRNWVERTADSLKPIDTLWELKFESVYIQSFFELTKFIFGK